MSGCKRIWVEMILFFAAVAANSGGDAGDGGDNAGGDDDNVNDDGGVSDSFSYDVGGADSGRVAGGDDVDGGADGGNINDSECLWPRYSSSPIILITSH